jgi:hypothetical protein
MNKPIISRSLSVIVAIALLFLDSPACYIAGWAILTGAMIGLFIYWSTLDNRLLSFICSLSLLLTYVLVAFLVVLANPGSIKYILAIDTLVITVACLIVIEYLVPIIIPTFISQEKPLNNQQEIDHGNKN